MSSNTNVEIPNLYSTWRMLKREIDRLKVEIDGVTRERDQLHREIENIVESVKEWGYVDIRREGREETVRLILKPEESHDLE